jgi:hypothetical protein
MSEAAKRQTALLERIATALERLATPQETADTVDVEGAARLLKTTQGGIYARHRRGKMPRRLPGRRLVWRTADLLRLGK